MLKSLSLICLLTVLFASNSSGEPLVLIGRDPCEATFVRADGNAHLIFQVDGQDQVVPHEELIRWSTIKPNSEKAELVLSDGSRLVLADSWTGEPSWDLTADSVSAKTLLFGKVIFLRSEVQAILNKAPKGALSRTKFMDRQINKSHQLDGIRLINGDRWEGKSVSVLKQDKGQHLVRMSLNEGSAPIEIPINRVAAIVLQTAHRSPDKPTALLVGTRDGSLVRASSLKADSDQLQVQLSCGVVLIGSDQRDVTYLRSQLSATEYLSDRPDIDYHHAPYLEIPWQFRRDRNVLGGLLQSGGKFYAKGLGVHTASRLSFDLKTLTPETKFRRFVASVALDAAAGKRGSVVFRVYLKRGKGWQQAFASPIVRGEDEPLPIAVELQDATQLALVTDFADRGDELDYANWLEARLE